MGNSLDPKPRGSYGASGSVPVPTDSFLAFRRYVVNDAGHILSDETDFRERDVASRIGWQCFNIWWMAAPGVEGLVSWLAAIPAKTILGRAGRREPGNNHPVRRRATDDMRSDPVGPTSIARPKACGDQSMAWSSQCDQVASRKALAGRPQGRETDTVQGPRAANVEGCLRSGGDGRSTRTIEG